MALVAEIVLLLLTKVVLIKELGWGLEYVLEHVWTVPSADTMLKEMLMGIVDVGFLIVNKRIL